MTRREHFTKHMRGEECDRWKDPDLPLLDRLVGAAHCKRMANGHARFEQGELRDALGIRNASTLTDLIERGVMRGRLAVGSCALCLLLTGVEGGAGGSPYTRCRVWKLHNRGAHTQLLKLAGEIESRASAHARRERERKAKKEQGMRVTMGTDITPEEWAAVLALREEQAAQSRRAEFWLVEENRVRNSSERPGGGA